MNTAEDELDKLITDLIDKYDSMGLRASGKYAKALRKEVIEKDGDKRLIVWGADYGHYMEYGRGATKTMTAGTPTLLELIKQWIIDKGLTGMNAYAVTNKIHKEGIEVPNDNNVGKVISSVITPQRVSDIVNKVASESINNAFSDILKNF